MITGLNSRDRVLSAKPVQRQHTHKYNLLNLQSVPISDRDTVSFKGALQEGSSDESLRTQKYLKAQKYADSLSKQEIFNLKPSQVKRLEGLQDGIKVFEGLSFKQVHFLMTNMKNAQFGLIRGCSGMCPPCCVNGRPNDRNLKDGIRKADFEDYKAFVDGLKQMGERLHFDYEEYISNKFYYELYCRGEKLLFALFWDSDCMNISLKDKEGKVHGFEELNKMMYDTIGVEGLFDTAGWSPANTKMNERMEALAEYYADPKHGKEILQVNISFNTYHGLYEKALDYKKAGDMVGYERMRKKYIDQMANAMYCFTPMLDTSKYKIFTKCLPHNDGFEFDDYKRNALQNMEKEVLEALENRYNEDLRQKNHKYVKSPEDVKKLVAKQKDCVLGYTTNILPSTRNNMFSKLHDGEIQYIKDEPNVSYYNALKRYEKYFVDINGQVYAFNAVSTAKTDIKLNFNNKNKQTDDVYPIPDTRVLDIENETYK